MEQLKELGKDFSTGAVMFITAVLILTLISTFTDFGQQVGTVSTTIGYGIFLFGIHSIGKKVRSKFFPAKKEMNG